MDNTADAEINLAHKKTTGQKLNFIYTIICWCSGARLYLLEKCPADYNKYFGIGLIVIMTSIMASISGGYALFTVFENYTASIFFGILWGILIFSIDWYIVSSLRKENLFRKEILSASPRLILAILIGIVISKPIELKLFEKEINQEIAFIQRENIAQFKEMIGHEYNEIEKLELWNEKLSSEIKNKEIQRQQLFDMIIEEAEGRSPTNIVGKGPVYKEKKSEFDNIQTELEQLRKRNLLQIDENLVRINELSTRRNEQIENGEIVNYKYGGFLGRINAINRLSEKNSAINLANWFIILLFVFIESSPMIVKLLSKRGPYDVLLEAEEQSNAVFANINLVESKAKQKEILNLNDQLVKFQYQSLIDSEKKFMKDVFETKIELDELRIKKWKERELQKANENIDESIEIIEKVITIDNKISN